MAVKATFIPIDTAAIDEAPHRYEIAAKRAIGQIMEYGRQRGREHAPELRGILSGKNGGLGGITFRIVVKGTVIIGVLTASAKNPKTGTDYAVFVHEGTGKYGPKKKLIYPKKKKVLAFMKNPFLPRPTTPEGWKMARIKGLVVFAKFSKGMKPNRFLKKALKDAKKIVPDIIDKHMKFLEGGAV